jgi:hypothetical protein
MMGDIKSNINVGLSGCLLQTKTEDDLLATLIVFFKKFQMYSLALHANVWIEALRQQVCVFATTVRHCGRLITKVGARFDPKNMETLQTSREQWNGAYLVQYIAAVNWMRSAIPNYSKRVAPLQAALAKGFEGKRRRTKKLQPQCRCYTFGDRRRKRFSKIYKQLSWNQ